MGIKKSIEKIISKVKDKSLLDEGKRLLSLGCVTFLAYNDKEFLFEISDIENPTIEGRRINIKTDADDNLDDYDKEMDAEYIACILALLDNIPDRKSTTSMGFIYTREGMMRRVLLERKEKADRADYKVKLGNFLYGPHTLYSDNNERYEITIWDFELYTGYIDNIDWKTNKLGTTKHIIFLIDYIKKHPELCKKLKKSSQFIEITTDPLCNYEITFRYNGKISQEQQEHLKRIFGKNTHITLEQFLIKLKFLKAIQERNDFAIRTEIYDALSAFYEEKEQMAFINKIKKKAIDYSFFKIAPFNYQLQGIEFCAFAKGAILADEMGLGKSIQAMGAALLKRKYYDFKKTLIICPASVKYQWKKEIEKFTNEIALVVEGDPNERAKLYFSEEHFFFIINYETVLRDKTVIDEAQFDYIILDEAQKIKNYETKASAAVSNLNKKHGLVITGTPIENKLIDLYAIMLFVDRYKITPLWEFSYQHCIFDNLSKNRINGYYDLKNLSVRLGDVLLRRQKRQVLKDLPNVVEQNIFLMLHAEQSYIHAGMFSRLASILAKKFKTAFDWDQIMLLLNNMRRVSNSTFLIDKETNFSSKMIELEHILFDQLDIKGENKKIIIFSEWLDSLYLIEKMLQSHQIGYTKLTGKVSPKKRDSLIKIFENQKDCKIFLSTEAGGAGLNLQVADTLINFEIPWNPAKKSQRIGRIDRLGQRAKKLHIFNLINKDSIEMHIASGLLLKQNLFDGVLNEDNNLDTVDFSQQGRAQFIKQLEEMMELNLSQDEYESDIMDKDEWEAVEAVSNNTDDENIINPQDEMHTAYDAAKVEAVMNKGMEFLAGMYEMATGQKLGGEGGHKIAIDHETGEIVMRFKI